MAAILNGFLPLRKKDNYARDRILNTRWGDAGISAPIHAAWSSQPPSTAEPSPELDSDLPPTPPQYQGSQDGVFIVYDEDEQRPSDDESLSAEKDHGLKMSLPWKKKSASHGRQPSINNVLHPRYGQAQKFDLMPPLATAEAAAIPLPESRISSPVNREVVNSPLARTTTGPPAMSFRSRLGSPNIGDMLSPVAEGFAKSGPSSRTTPVLSSLQYVQDAPPDRATAASPVRSAGSHVSSLHSYNSTAEGMGVATMSSQATTDEQMPEYHRPPSRGLGATMHMRASSRGPRAGSKGPRAGSVEPFARRAISVEPVDTGREITQTAEVVIPSSFDLQPVRRRAPSVEPARRRAPSIEPVNRRAPSVEPVRTRAPSVEPGSRRAPSVGPGNRRAASREPRGRRGFSVEPTRRRHHSEAPRKATRDSFSSNDGSAESGSDREISETEYWADTRFDRDFKSSRRPRRRRSIASPVTSPTASSFKAASPPLQAVALDSIAARAGLIGPGPLPAQRNVIRNRSQSRTRGLYADMHDDFRLLARDVHINMAHTQAPVVSAATTVVPSPATAIASSPTTTAAPALPQAPGTSIIPVASPISQQALSPALSSNSTFGACVAIHLEPERTGYSSDSSLTGLPTVASHSGASPSVPYARLTESSGGRAFLAAMARERKDQLRREERERARERVARRVEREKERLAVLNALSDCESITSAKSLGVSGAEKTRRFYGSSGLGVGYESDASLKSWTSKAEQKELVKNHEEIWG